MPAKSKQQLKLIWAIRRKYGKKKNAPKKWKWVFEEGWENKGKLPKKVKKIDENFKLLFESETEGYAKEIKEGFNELSGEIEKLEITIREYQKTPHEDLDGKYRVLADNLQMLISNFIEQYSIY